MSYKVGDKIILKNDTKPYIGNSNILPNKEYTILDVYEGSFSGKLYYTIKDDTGDDDLIYKDFITISPVYLRDQTINEILK